MPRFGGWAWRETQCLVPSAELGWFTRRAGGAQWLPGSPAFLVLLPTEMKISPEVHWDILQVSSFLC